MWLRAWLVFWYAATEPPVSPTMTPSPTRSLRSEPSTKPLRNTRHEAFARSLSRGMTADAAYRTAGYREHRGSASRLRANANIQRRVAEITARAAERVEVAKADVRGVVQPGVGADRLRRLALAAGVGGSGGAVQHAVDEELHRDVGADGDADVDPLRLAPDPEVAGAALLDGVAMGLGVVAVGAAERPDARDAEIGGVEEVEEVGAGLGDAVGIRAGRHVAEAEPEIACRGGMCGMAKGASRVREPLKRMPLTSRLASKPAMTVLRWPEMSVGWWPRCRTWLMGSPVRCRGWPARR